MVRERFPPHMNDYHEPFLGGGSVLFALLADREAGKVQMDGTVYASDANAVLIRVYQRVQMKVEEVIQELREICDEFAALKGTEVNRHPKTLEEAKTSQESYYYWTRAQYNEHKKKKSARFIFLNKTCFRGVFRVGPNGFNVPFGHYSNPTIFDADHLRAVSALLTGVVFTVNPFAASLEPVRPGDFVYLDPPYAPLNATTFVGYTVDGFGLDEHRALFARCDELRRDRVSLLLSNADVELVTDAFPSPVFDTLRIMCRRAINSTNPESKAKEVLISCRF